MRIVGGVMIVLGLLFCLTVVGAIIGLPMMLIGLALVIAGRSNPTVVVQMNHHAPHYHPHPQPHYPPPGQPQAGVAGYGDPQAQQLPPAQPEPGQPAAQPSPAPGQPF